MNAKVHAAMADGGIAGDGKIDAQTNKVMPGAGIHNKPLVKNTLVSAPTTNILPTAAMAPAAKSPSPTDFVGAHISRPPVALIQPDIRGDQKPEKTTAGASEDDLENSTARKRRGFFACRCFRLFM
jgi:hypothetical protein